MVGEELEKGRKQSEKRKKERVMVIWWRKLVRSYGNNVCLASFIMK